MPPSELRLVPNFRARQLLAELVVHYSAEPQTKQVVAGVDKSSTEWSASDGMAEVFALQGMRSHMEDRFCILADKDSNIYLYGVFDGHGGESAAEFAEKKLFPAILERIQDTIDADIEAVQEILRSEILKLDEAFVQQSKKVRNYSGTTCLVAIVFRETLIVANVGDSRGVMANVKGRSIPLSFDHKPQQLKEQKRIKDAGGFISFNGVWRVAGILATSRALGDYPLKERKLVTAEPDILTFNLTQQHGAFFILASDGLWDAFTSEEAVNFLHQRQSVTGASQELARKAYQKGSQDNITVLIVDLSKYGLLQKSLDHLKQDRERVAKLQAQTLIKAAKEKTESQKVKKADEENQEL